MSRCRTIRYYYQIRLLPVPDARDGVRDYDLVHVARLTLCLPRKTSTLLRAQSAPDHEEAARRE